MNKKKILAGILSLAIAFAFIAPFTMVNAQTSGEITFPDEPTFPEGLSTTDTINNILSYLLGFLGILAVVIILYGGLRWMTAGGDAKKVEPAQNTIKAGAIGLIIILAAWVIVKVVLGFGQGLLGAVNTGS